MAGMNASEVSGKSRDVMMTFPPYPHLSASFLQPRALPAGPAVLPCIIIAHLARYFFAMELLPTCSISPHDHYGTVDKGARRDLRFLASILIGFAPQDKHEAQQRETILGGLKGFTGGLAFALPTSYLLHRKWPYYRALPPSLKAFGVILVAVPSFVISAEHAALRFEEEHW